VSTRQSRRFDPIHTHKEKPSETTTQLLDSVPGDACGFRSGPFTNKYRALVSHAAGILTLLRAGHVAAVLLWNPAIAPDGSSDGTAWLDIYPNNTGFIALNTSSLHTTVYITGAYRTPNSIGQTASITVTFTGAADPDSDGDTDNLTGSATFSFNYVYNRLTRFYLLYVASGSVTYSIAN
jgi:hypothetical protein